MSLALFSPTSRILAGSVAGLLLLACEQKVPEPERRPQPASSTPPATPTPAKPKPKGPSKLEKKDLTEGKGPAAKTGDRVSVHYTGTLLDGTKFDSSLDRDEPFEFTLGAGEVIKGWDQGVVGMKKGGKRELLIPSELAYGKRGSGPKIGPDTPLKFEIELLEIK